MEKIVSRELICLREGDEYLNNPIKCFKYYWQVYTEKIIEHVEDTLDSQKEEYAY